MQRISFALAIIGLFVNTAAALDGSGTEVNPWRIESLDDFNEFAADANYWAGYTRLETDVNLAGRVYTTAVIAPDVNNVNYDFDSTAFTGIFDGNNHKIMNLTIDDGGAGNDYLGLFGYIIDSEVSNLGLIDGFVSGDFCVGGLVGYNSGFVSNCYSIGDVGGDRYIGGLVGRNVNGSVSNCYSTGDVSGNYMAGGLVGINVGSVTKCYSTGDVNGMAYCRYMGGLVGYNKESVSDCYSASDVSGDGSVGGLVGINGSPHLAGEIMNSFSTGNVCGNHLVGGLVGINSYYSNVSNCFWDIEIQIHDVTISIGDNLGMATNVEGLPTAQMLTKTTFANAGWDFVEIWNIGENQTYPYLRVYPAGDINHDDIVNMLDFALFADHWLEGKGN